MLDRLVLGVRIRRRLANVDDEDIAAVHAALDHLKRRLGFRTVRAIEERVIPLPIVADHWRSGRLDELRSWRPPKGFRFRAAAKVRRPTSTADLQGAVQ